MQPAPADNTGTPGSDAGGALQLVKRGGSWLFDAPEFTPAVWGDGGDVLWAMGEPLIVAGPPGVGKSTLVQQVALKRLGLPSHALEQCGYSVTPDPDRRVLYLALDREAQIRRSMRRMVRPSDRTPLDAGLAVVTALDFDPLERVDGVAHLVAVENAGTLVVDSLYNLAGELTKDATAHRVNLVLKAVLALGCEVVLVHHTRKATSDNRNPNKAADLYGSRFIEAAAGSVLMLEGEAGSSEVKLHHRKQPVNLVGPLELVHDHEAGVTTSVQRPSVAQALERLGRATAAQVAASVYGEDAIAERAVVQKTRRQLDKLVKAGKATKDSAGEGVTYSPVKGACTTVQTSVHARSDARTCTTGENKLHATVTQLHAHPEGAPCTEPLMSGVPVQQGTPPQEDNLGNLMLQVFPGAVEVPVD